MLAFAASILPPTGAGGGPRRPRTRGQAIVEFALFAVMLTMLLFGAIEVGRALYYYITLTNASREAARKGVNCQVSSSIQAWANTAIAGVAITPTVAIAFTRPTIPNYTPVANQSPNPSVSFGSVTTPTVGDTINVTVSTQYSSIAPVAGAIFNNITISSVSSSYIEQVNTVATACP